MIVSAQPLGPQMLHEAQQSASLNNTCHRPHVTNTTVLVCWGSHTSFTAAAIAAAQALLIVVGNPAVLMHDKHWLALLLHCQAHGACVGQPMPDLSEAEAAAAAAAGGDSNTSGAAAGSSSNGNGSAFSASASSGLQQEMEQLGRLMASIAISNGVDDVAQQLLLQDALGFSGLVDEVGGGMARRE